MNKLLLIDGNSIMNRAFYGLPLLSDAKGRYTNAVFGFLNILFKTIDDEAPTHLLVAFDSHAPTFRHETYKEYKGNRKGMPDELRSQMPLIREVLDTMNIATYVEDGIEADDILGSLSLRFEDEGEVTVLSGDRDLLQLASEKTKISIPRTKGGTTTTEHYDYNSFMETYGFTPTQFIDVKGMMGDSSDNIPGIPGVGEKTAHKYIKKYQTLEGLYEHIDDLKGKTKEKVEANRELAFVSRDLATIKRDCSIEINLEQMRLEDYLNDQTFDLFKELNFTRLLTRFDFKTIEAANDVKDLEFKVFDQYPSYIETITKEAKAHKIAFYAYQEEDYLGLVCLVKKSSKNIQRFIYEQSTPLADDSKIGQDLLAVFSQAEQVLFYDIKAWMHAFHIPEEQVKFAFDDVHLMFYLAKPNKGDYPLLDLGLSYTDITLHTLDDLLGKGKKKVAINSIDASKRQNFLAQCVSIIHDSFKGLTQALVEDEMLGLYNTLEKPLLLILYSMEKEGICVDKQVLTQLSERLEVEIAEIQKHIFTLAGHEFNINSPKQLGVILFEELGLPVIKKTKTGYSTNVDVLEKLESKHPIIREILHYRQLTKLKSTYADGLFPYVLEDGKIHTTFNQTIASTGRLSSTEPNLQNIPIRLEEGRLIRKAFVPKQGHVFVSADYSQIELRVLAHLSQDDLLLEAYRENKDIHQLTASQVFHVPFDEVTKAMRRNAKAVNFGIVYGISDFGLSRDLNIPISEAKTYIQAYFDKYPKVKAFLDLTVAKAYEDGYVVTMYNRKRLIPELSNSNYMRRSFGERIAMNTPIQGSAADIIKIAMIKVYNRLKKEQLKSKMLLQIHDELIIEAPIQEQERVKNLLIEEMENAVILSVPMVADASIAKNWYEAK
ncbi:DNA polymerase I [Vallitaleaceae bacterium 9-2]